MIGIYKILNKINGKVYIGQSVNLQHRLKEHKLKLQKNIHANKHLQNAWNKYGEENFEFIVVEQCAQSDLTNREQYWLCYFGGYTSDETYNKKSAEKHAKYSQQSKQKMSISQKKRNLNGKNNPMFGKHHSLQTRQKISQMHKGRFVGEKNSRFGAKLTKEHKLKLSQAHKGKHLSTQQKQKISKTLKNVWQKLKQDANYMRSLKLKCSKNRKYSDDQKQEIYNVYKQVKSRKAAAIQLGLPLESCRLIINDFLTNEKLQELKKERL